MFKFYEQNEINHNILKKNKNINKALKKNPVTLYILQNFHSHLSVSADGRISLKKALPVGTSNCTLFERG